MSPPAAAADTAAKTAAETAAQVDWSALPAPQPGLRCSVVLPARNEAVLLPIALRALAGQRGVDFAYELVVLANNCSDDTAERARAFAAGCTACAVHVAEMRWPAGLANVGRARRALMDVAAQRLADAGSVRGIVVSTDADTRVAPDWLAATVAAIDAGADAVGGRIVVDPDEALPPAAQQLMRLDDVYRRWRARLECLVDPDPADPWPRHHQHFGASLAVTESAYRAVGGQPLVPFLEDEALVRELRLADKPVRHCPQVRVHTSARLNGRAEVGLSWQLREWSSSDAGTNGPRVPDPAREAHRWALRRRLRSLWRQPAERRSTGDLAALADAFRVEGAWLAKCVTDAATFGSLWETVEQQCEPLASQVLPMGDALRRLRWLISAERPAERAADRAAARWSARCD